MRSRLKTKKQLKKIKKVKNPAKKSKSKIVAKKILSKSVKKIVAKKTKKKNIRGGFVAFKTAARHAVTNAQKKSLPNYSKIENNLRAETAPALKPPAEPARNFIKKTNTKCSPYLLDLKKIGIEKQESARHKQSQSEIITAEIFSKFKQNTKPLKRICHNFRANLAELKPQQKIKYLESTGSLIARKPSHLKLPKLSWPSWRLPKLQPRELRLGNFILPTYWKRAVITFILFCLIFSLPFALYGNYQDLQGKKNDVLQKTGLALNHLLLSKKAASAQDLYYTQFELQAASQNFTQANQDLANVNFIIQGAIRLMPRLGEQYVAAQKLTNVGEKLSRSAALLADTISKINLGDNAQNMNLTDKLITLKENLVLISMDLNSANADLQQIDISAIPSEYQDKIQTLQTALPILEKNFTNFTASADLIAQLLGQESKKRYLLLFQNNHELRPTGGFIGSYALIDIDRGNISKINVPGGGPYDLKAGLKVNIKSPTPLNIINTRWEFQDANWFANLPASAEKLNWFYENSGGPTIDGMIFVNATFLEKVLKLTGPIELPDYNLTITADNFFSEIQTNVELNYDQAQNKPKQIIADLAPIIIDRLLHSDRQKFTEILDQILNSLDAKEIQFYFSNFNIEKMVLKNNWGGEQKNTEKDYLEVVSTNIAGEKTDAVIKQSANLAVDIKPDGSIINTLTITKSHTGTSGENFYGVPNLDYLRIYVPKDSELVSALGFSSLPEELFVLDDSVTYDIDPDLAYGEFSRKLEPISQTAIYNEGGKTVFANWLKVEPGQSQTITVQYKLPFILNLKAHNQPFNLINLIKEQLSLEKNDPNTDRYSLLWQKQSGKENFDVTVSINFPPNLQYQLTYPDGLQKDGDKFNFAAALNTDKFLAVIFNSANYEQ
ncbi:MAG: DUF4012 domain-containing protein [Patescibacteria group bacterium]